MNNRYCDGMNLLYAFKRFWFFALCPFQNEAPSFSAGLARKVASGFPSGQVYRSWQRIQVARPSNQSLIGSLFVSEVPGRQCYLCSGWVFHPVKPIVKLHVLSERDEMPITLYGRSTPEVGKEFPFFKTARRSGFVGELPRDFVKHHGMTVTLKAQFQSGAYALMNFKIAPQSREIWGVPL
ncbi:MAG: hypothetical protein KDD62_02435 [Bdellovibrionales bacterium]|nr:hypothetical protein [Bdellovibrionales bacterium]